MLGSGLVMWLAQSDSDDGLQTGDGSRKKWQRLRGYKWLEKVVEGVEFIDGVMKKAA